MKHRELKAADSIDEFKISDLINVYTFNTRLTNLYVSTINITDETLNTRSGSFHFKQCRKLEPVKPREIWVNDFNDGLGSLIWHNKEDAIDDLTDHDDSIRVIRFVEASEE